MPTRKQILGDKLFLQWADAKGYARLGFARTELAPRSDEELIQLYREFYFDKGILPPWETASTPTPSSTAQQQADYNDYSAFIKQYPELGLPVPKDINDFIEHQAEWEKEFAPSSEPEPEEHEAPEPEPGEHGYQYNDDQIREYYTYRNYASAYGDPKDWYPNDIDDYFKNYDVAQEQLNEWTQEEKDQEKPTYTDAQNREYNTYKRYASAYGDPNDWYALGVKDYFDNYDTAQTQLTKWQQEEIDKGVKQTEYEAEQTKQKAEYEAKQAEYEKWALSPEEQARRREEGYQSALESRARAEYARQEAYGEAPEYQKPFSQWLQTQGDQSQYLKDYIESKYPSLRTQFTATQPRLTGYPTRERARAEAERREAGFKAWLPVQLPTVEAEFWGQAPAQRGERPQVYNPRSRYIAW